MVVRNVRSRTEDFQPRINGQLVRWNRSQYEFIQTEAENAWLAGAFGVGKTYSLLWRGARLSFRIPGGSGMVGTNRSPQFYRVVLPKLKDIWKGLIVDERKKPIHQIWTRTAGEQPFCWTLQPYGEPDKLGGDDLNIVLGDEMSLCPKESHHALAPRMRHPGSKKHYICYASNNKGKDWLWQMFVKDNPNNTRPDYWWKTTSTYENLHNLPKGYLGRFKGFPKKWWDRNIMGLFIEFSGMVYDMLDSRMHQIPTPKIIKPYWNVTFSLDHGFDHPTFGIIWATDEFNNTFSIEEYVQRGMDPMDNAENFSELLLPYKNHGMFGVYGFADPSMWASHGGHNPMEDYEDVFLDKGLTPPLEAYKKSGPFHNIKLSGVYKVIGKLKPRQKHRHIITGKDPAPTLYFGENCPETWQSMTDLTWDEEAKSGVERVRKMDGDDGADNTWYHIWNDPEQAKDPEAEHKKREDEARKKRLERINKVQCSHKLVPAGDFDAPAGVGFEDEPGVVDHSDPYSQFVSTARS